jgi:hypothetical protein
MQKTDGATSTCLFQLLKPLTISSMYVPQLSPTRCSGLRPPGSVSPQRRRSSIIDVASAGARKLKNMAKLKSVVRVIGLAKRMQKVQNDGTETDPSSGPKRSTSKNGMFGSLKSMKKSRKDLSTGISTRRINTTTKTQNNNEKNAKVQKEKIVAKKHENLVDQVMPGDKDKGCVGCSTNTLSPPHSSSCVRKHTRRTIFKRQ